MNLNQSEGHAVSITLNAFNQFEEKGYIGPFPLLNEADIELLCTKCSTYPDVMLPWMKGKHTAVKEMAELSMHPIILEKIIPLLGNDLLLSGSQHIKQKPFDTHRWHIDVEHMAWEGITVWIAMKNVVSQQSFSVITGSHLFNTTPQELEASHSLNLKNEIAVLNAAKMISPSSELVHLEVEDGQFIIFKGKLWHGTKNVSTNTRQAIILQYTTPAHKVKAPKSNKYPDTPWYTFLPSCLLVHGKDNYGYNKLMNIDSETFKKSYINGILFNFPKNILRKLRRSMKLLPIKHR